MPSPKLAAAMRRRWAAPEGRAHLSTALAATWADAGCRANRDAARPAQSVIQE